MDNMDLGKAAGSGSPALGSPLVAPIKGFGVGLLACYVFMRWISQKHGALVTHLVPPALSHDSSSRLRKVSNAGFRNRERERER